MAIYEKIIYESAGLSKEELYDPKKLKDKVDDKKDKKEKLKFIMDVIKLCLVIITIVPVTILGLIGSQIIDLFDEKTKIPTKIKIKNLKKIIETYPNKIKELEEKIKDKNLSDDKKKEYKEKIKELNKQLEFAKKELRKYELEYDEKEVEDIKKIITSYIIPKEKNGNLFVKVNNEDGSWSNKIHTHWYMNLSEREFISKIKKQKPIKGKNIFFQSFMMYDGGPFGSDREEVEENIKNINIKDQNYYPIMFIDRNGYGGEDWYWFFLGEDNKIYYGVPGLEFKEYGSYSEYLKFSKPTNKSKFGLKSWIEADMELELDRLGDK